MPLPGPATLCGTKEAMDRAHPTTRTSDSMIPTALVIPLVWLVICLAFSPVVFGIISEAKAERTPPESGSMGNLNTFPDRAPSHVHDHKTAA